MAPISRDDRDIVDAVLSGDRDAYRVLVERESSSVVGLCASILHDMDDAQDVAQDAFVQAYRLLASYRGDGSFGAWVGRIAKRMAIANSVSHRQRDVTDIDGVEIAAVPGTDPERQAVRIEEREALQQAISELPADQQEVVSLRFYRDMPLEQIAAVTGAPLGTVKSRLHRGLARLRDRSDLRPTS
ncbi:MAG: sigma-70 family RNA polymerase sigma factor [Candidatus Limnocylindrales bacterium]